MAIFGDDILRNGTVYHQATTLDRVLDYVFLVLSIILLIVSCVCNPVVFWFHRKMKQTTPAIMFQILTANDFLTCLIMVPVMIYYLSNGKPSDLASPEHALPWQICHTMIKSAMFCWSFSLTAILGTVRCIVIHFPFFRISKALVLSIAVGMGLYTIGVSLAKYFESPEHVWSLYSLQMFAESFVTERALSPAFIVGYTKATCNMCVSLSSAALSVWGLKRAEKQNEMTKGGEKKRGGKEAAVTIAYLNILIGLQFLLMVMSLVVRQRFPQQVILMNYLFFLTWPFSNTLISAINPLIYIIRSSKIREALMKTAPTQISRAYLSENTNQQEMSSKH